MQALREELEKKDAEFFKKQQEYEVRVQEVEAQLRQRMEESSHPAEEHPRLQPELDEGMELITPEVEVVLSVAAQKQKETLAEDPYDDKTQNGAGRRGRRRTVTFLNEECRTFEDVVMSSDGDRRNAGIGLERESASPQPVSIFIKSVPYYLHAV